MAALEKDYEEVGAESLEGAGEDEECYLYKTRVHSTTLCIHKQSALVS